MFKSIDYTVPGVSGDTFRLNVPVSMFEKAGAPEHERRRIGGLISTETRDRQDETVLARGLDLSEFCDFGWYNNNHGRDPTDVLGYPDPSSIRMVQKGECLPDGETSPAAGYWAEGWLIPGYKKADEFWELGQSLHKAGGRRRLGFSIEGKILRRSGPAGKIIAKATVRNVAITHCPVNFDTGLSVLAKSLESAEQEDVARAMSAGSSIPVAGEGPKTGEGAGRVLSRESLEKEAKNQSYKATDEKKKIILTKAEAFAIATRQFPQLSCEQIGRFIDLTWQLRHREL